MGNAVRSRLDPSGQRQVSQAISKRLAEDGKADRRIVKLLLLGTGDSGKSTIMKQVKILHDRGFSKEELLTARPVVYQNLFTSMRQLLDAISATEMSFENEDSSSAHAKVIRAVTEEIHQTINRSFVPDEDQCLALKELWADQAVQRCFELHRHQYHIQDSSAVFFKDLSRLLDPAYIPTTEDLLRLRVCTTGVIEAPFKVKFRGVTLTFKLIDVGGQRSERRKWIHCFENVNAVLFVVSLSEYNQLLIEDGLTNRMEESLKLFETIVNNKFFVHSSFILFLNKKDLFEEKIKRFPLSDYLSSYTGPSNDPESARQHIADSYLSKVRPPAKPKEMKFERKTSVVGAARPVYHHFTCATDTNQIKLIFEDVVQSVIDRALAESALQ